MITIKHKGNFNKTERFLTTSQRTNSRRILEEYGHQGVSALSLATPIDSGLTAASWDFVIKVTNRGYKIEWFNTNINDGASIAILIQYGHGTGSGAYVEGIDYINPAMKPIFDRLSESLWEEVHKL